MCIWVFRHKPKARAPVNMQQATKTRSVRQRRAKAQNQAFWRTKAVEHGEMPIERGMQLR